MKRVLNLGAGTQSSVVLLLMERGEMPRADVAVFADTGWEPKAVYEHLDWLREQTSIPIVEVSAGNILRDAWDSQVRGTKEAGRRWASMPLYVLNHQRVVAGPGETLWGIDDAEYVVDLPAPEDGQVKRQCTREYKVDPIQKWIKQNVLHLSPRGRWPVEAAVAQTFGISFDERSRMRQPPAWARFEYPLVDRKWHRGRVIEWAREHYPGRVFPRSACVGCPFHSNDEWRWIRDNDPGGWAQAVALDRRLRNAGGMRGEVFLHRSCVPLDEADIEEPDTEQTRIWHGFENECVGVCGV